MAAVTVGWCSGGLVRYSLTYRQGPITSRSETLDLHGMVKGTFNFLDSRGNIKTRQYDYRIQVGQPWVNISPPQVQYSPQKPDYSPPETRADPLFQHYNDSEASVKESDVATEEPELVQDATTILPPTDIPEPKQGKAKEADIQEELPASVAAVGATESV